ncbi:TlrC/CarA/OleB/SrmB family ABC-F type ribosomal protection protein [Streptomyces sp. 3MP-14]|uniref:TlrC/CarA/OleB/SrmB family ABC-F type ribosomal protection protein n=1 Tax=Streptomyces mimosae TaxID=2586635 RepID=A0A5N6AEN1_9ACTN|nr:MULTISPECIES: TlrC/CarA/OleB/SrmB family ABC-F type ribosomal protection protein [Streptomyces]KAB8167274.1 TlrC/CarA/OleB/SrmB family ABC-F type ribosomal protection protein [Streptomyces mimosae]KAB8177214.1 TlrC/CarA/OleB/SrmB family ABC-F type ribosomal protection protein [Streptomyces sp. 3MP-14]
MPVATASQLTLRDITKRYDAKTVLHRVTLAVSPGEKVGVIGDNGSGKSTLLRLIAGFERPDQGELTVSAPGGLGYLPQTLALPPQASVAEAIDEALADLRQLEERIRRAEAALAGPEGPELDAAMANYATLVERYEARDGYQAEAKVDIALHALGLPELARDRRIGTLSGGERSRLALAATLAASPELLLLDEPTNDLDDQAVGWLEDQLRAHRGTVVAVTHDRVFLERLTTTVLEIEAGAVTRHGDGYAGYLRAKAAERRRRLQQYEDWLAELERNERIAESNVDRLDAIPRKNPMAAFGHGAFRQRGREHGAASRIRNARERVERLTADPVAPPPEPLTFTGRIEEAGEVAEGPAVELRGVEVAGRLSVPSLRLGHDERVLITGPNGAGKSTLLRVIAGELTPDAGTVAVPGRVGHLRQRETPWPERYSVLRAFAHGRGGPGDLDEHIETLLSLGLFEVSELGLRIGELSYGQRRRIELARLVTEPVDVLLLDEPTNHLSPALVEGLEEALADYHGTLVVVTHDRRLRARFTGRQLSLRNGRFETPDAA